MSLTGQFTGYFDSGVQHRGDNYFRAGRVHIDSASASRIVAVVNGSERYRVELKRKGRKIDATCTCPYFDVDFCKHIWAAILAAEKQPLLQGKRLKLVHRDYDDDEFDSDLDEDDDSGDEDEDDNEDDDEDESENDVPVLWSSRPVPERPPQPARAAKPRSSRKPKAPSWREQIAGLLGAQPSADSPSSEPWPATRELLYVINVAGAGQDGALHLEVLWRDLKMDGGWSKPKSRYLRREWQQQTPDVNDRQILASLAGATPVVGQNHYGYQSTFTHDGTLPHRYHLIDPQPRLMLPLLCRTGRCHLRLPNEEGEDEQLGPPLTWQDGEPWHFRLEMRGSREIDQYEIFGALRRGEERMDLTAPVVLFEAGILCMREWAGLYVHHGAFAWITLLREHGPLRVPRAQIEEFLAELLRQPRLPPVDLPEELRYDEVLLTPRPRLTVNR